MHRIKHIISIIAVISVFTIIVSSCQKEDPEVVKLDPEIILLPDSLPSDSKYTTSAQVDDGLQLIYKMYHASYGSSKYWVALCAFTGADDLTSSSSDANRYYREADQFAGTSSHYYMNDIFEAHYDLITLCNSFISKIDVNSFDEVYINNAIGNAKFFRALAYFNLTIIFGDVPLFTTLDSASTLGTSEQILNQVIHDLEYANENVLNERDKASGVNSRTVNEFASRTAAKAFIAKSHMALAGWPINATTDASGNNNWDMVKKYSKEIIDDGTYSLLDDYAHNFGNVGTTFSGIGQQRWEGNKEAIWSIVCNDEGTVFYSYLARYNANGYFYGPAWAEWAYLFLEWNFYENMRVDYRKQYSVTDNKTWSYLKYTDYPYPERYQHPFVMKFQWGAVSESYYRKYKGLYSGDDIPNFPGYEGINSQSNDIPVIRYAEVVLMYAEACAMLGETAEATEKLNWIRRRAYAGGLPAVMDTIASSTLGTEYWKNATPAIDYPQAGETDLIKAIIQERSWEFVGELGGVRWFDLTRREMVGEALAPRATDTRELDLLGNPSDQNNWRFPLPLY